jgi:imidazolonepropionase-like amidohydrolase
MKLALAGFLVGTSAAAFGASVEKLSVVSNGAVIGSVAATIDGRTETVDYAVSNNGRGPKDHATLTLGANGIPVSWTIRGSSVMGAPIDESYNWSNGRAHWVSEPDKGEVASPTPKLYLVSEDSPWVLGTYARALLAAPGHKLDMLPSGTMSLAKVRDAEIGGVPVSVYRLDGAQVDPDYVLLDKQQRLFATLKQAAGGMSALLSVRAGFEKQEQALRSLLDSVEMARAHDLARRLAHDYGAPIRIINVHVFDPASGTLGPATTVVVDKDRIVRTAALPDDSTAAGKGEVVVDGQGGTLVPGLADMHAHMTLQSGILQIAGGVTTARDMGNDNQFMQKLVPAIDRGEIIGPHLVLNGFIEGKSPFSAHAGFVVDSADAAIAAARWYADHGYWRIKIYNSMKPEWVKPLAAEAHRLGMGVCGHIPAFTTPDAMMLAGYDELTHLNQLMLGWLLKPGEDSRTPLRLMAMARAATLDLSSAPVTHTIDLMKQRHVPLDTTASIFEWLMLSRAGAMPPTDTAFYDHMPIGFRRAEQRTYVQLKAPGDDDAFRKGFAKMIELMGLLHRNGIQLLPGTDNSNGFTLHRELVLYTMAGLTPAEALRADTLDIARYFGRTEETGSIERGKRADLMLVAGDPTRDINAINAPRMVIKSGTVYFPSEIYTALGIEPFAAPPPVSDPR